MFTPLQIDLLTRDVTSAENINLTYYAVSGKK